MKMFPPISLSTGGGTYQRTVVRNSDSSNSKSKPTQGNCPRNPGSSNGGGTDALGLSGFGIGLFLIFIDGVLHTWRRPRAGMGLAVGPYALPELSTLTACSAYLGRRPRPMWVWAFGRLIGAFRRSGHHLFCVLPCGTGQMAELCAFVSRQRRISIPVWGNAPGSLHKKRCPSSAPGRISIAAWGNAQGCVSQKLVPFCAPTAHLKSAWGNAPGKRSPKCAPVFRANGASLYQPGATPQEDVSQKA